MRCVSLDREENKGSLQLSKEAGNDSWTWREDALWRTVTSWFAWEASQNQAPKWFVFEFGDVATRMKQAGEQPGT